MPSKQTITSNKQEIAKGLYCSAFSKTHILIKLAEEASELSQICLKLIDKDHLALPIPSDLVSDFWEEMAHTMIFWGMARKVMGNNVLLDEHYNERATRIAGKVENLHTDEPYYATLCLGQYDDSLPDPVNPYYLRANGELCRLLTKEEFFVQLKSFHEPWRDPDSLIVGDLILDSTKT